MGNISQKDREFIESKLSRNTKLDEKVLKEYIFLKNTVLHPERNLPQFNEKIDKVYVENFRVLINPLKFNKREERFAKWIKMVYPNQGSGNITKTASTKSSGSLPVKNTIEPSTPGSKFIMNYYQPLDSSASIYEFSLKKYYSQNAIHFKQRVEKGPPDSLRWTAWAILSNLPSNRSKKVLENYVNSGHIIYKPN